LIGEARQRQVGLGHQQEQVFLVFEMGQRHHFEVATAAEGTGFSVSQISVSSQRTQQPLALARGKGVLKDGPHLHAQFPQKSVTLMRSCVKGPMGEVINASSGFAGGLGGGFSLVSGVVSLLALGVYALLQGDTGNNNDDDDSSPGGGLMQPVA
jgi:hypothetical protein